MSKEPSTASAKCRECGAEYNVVIGGNQCPECEGELIFDPCDCQGFCPRGCVCPCHDIETPSADHIPDNRKEDKEVAHVKVETDVVEELTRKVDLNKMWQGAAKEVGDVRKITWHTGADNPSGFPSLEVEYTPKL